ITRLGTGTGTPFVDITNANATVNNDVTTYTIGGTNNAQVVGGMSWSNDQGGSGVLSSATPWEISGISLTVGANVITVTGTNIYGISTNDTVTITRLAAGMPYIIITNAPSTWDVTSTPYVLAGTNNANVVGIIGCSNAQTGVKIDAVRYSGGLSWTGTLELVSGDNYLWVYGTNIAGDAVDDYIVVNYSDYIDNLLIILSNDYQRTILTWSNDIQNVTILAQTNQYYNTAGPWFVLATGQNSGYVHETASNYWACYYKLIDATGASTSRYDVGKMTFDIQQSDGITKKENWISCPFELMNDDCEIVQQKSFDLMMVKMCLNVQGGPGFNRDFVQSQKTIGNNTIQASYGNGTWFPTDPDATNWFANKMYMIVINELHPCKAKPLTMVGRVPTNEIEFVGTIQQSDGVTKKENWVAYPYPALSTFGQGRIADVLTAQGGPGFNRDLVQSQESIGGNAIQASYGSGIWYPTDPAATNFFGGKGYMISINELHTGAATNWYSPKPY
ncbi:MAG: hypothetical protein DRG30_09725, partial [Epsilonproteobacteria bacterium]